MNKTTWLDGVDVSKPHPSLDKDISCDVVIVGGGLAGTFAAYLLSKNGKKVVIIDRKDISETTTAYTTAWLTQGIDNGFGELVKMYEPVGTKKIWSSHGDAINLVESVVKEEQIDCEFKRVSAYRFAHSKDEYKDLKEEQALATELGFGTRLHNGKHLSFDNYGSLELPNQAKFHPIKFLLGLRKAAEKYGARIYENTEATDIQEGTTIAVITKYGKIIADYGIIATYQPFNNPIQLFAHKGMYLSYVFEVEIQKGKIPEGLYEDEHNPYHYFRIDAGEIHDRMVIGGEDHRKEIPISKEKNFTALEEYLKDIVHGSEYKIVKRWSGQVLETIDGLAYIGNFSKNHPLQLVATGFSGNGMTYSAIAATIFRDIILGKENPYLTLYSAARRTRPYNFMKKFYDYGQEFIGGALKNFFR